MNKKSFLTFSAFFILSLLAAEFFIRFQYNKTTHFAPPEAGWTVFDEELSWVPGANMSGEEKGAVISMNSDGARGKEFEKDPDILAIGDSFTLGALVNDDETWPFFLNELTDDEVANFGVCAYGVDQMYLRTQKLLKNYDPKVVVMGLIEDNFYRSALDRWVTGEKRLKFIKNDEGHWVAPNKKLTPNQDQKTTYRDWKTILTDWSRIWLLGPYDDISMLNKTPRFYREGVEISLQLIERLNEQLTKEGIEFHVLLLGGQFERWGMKAKLESLGVSLIDCSEVYQDENHIIPGDGHPSVMGHKAYAHCLTASVDL